jgi:hypothetical protein
LSAAVIFLALVRAALRFGSGKRRQYQSDHSKGDHMAKGFIHTVFKGGEWINEVEEGSAFGGPHRTKDAAVSEGRERAKRDKTEHAIHNQDGTISERNSYGRDPVSRPG